MPSVDSLRALYAPDTTGGRAQGRPRPAAARHHHARVDHAGRRRRVEPRRVGHVGAAAVARRPGRARRDVAGRAHTTRTTPILPEGTTRQLSDLDRIFVEVEGPGISARLGDVDLTLSGSSFAPLRRQAQGAVLEARVPRDGHRVRRARDRIGLGHAGSVPQPGRRRPRGRAGAVPARGPGRRGVRRRRARQRARLPSTAPAWSAAPAATTRSTTGPASSRSRPLRLITGRAPHHGRLRVHGRRLHRGTLAVAGADLELGRGTDPRGRLGVRVFREADALGSLAEIGLGDDEIALIRAAGDTDVTVAGEQRVPFDPTSPVVLYTRRDTVVADSTIQIFVPAGPSDLEVFRVRFSRLAPAAATTGGRGARSTASASSTSGPGNGDFVPRRLLPRPAGRTLVDVRGSAVVVPRPSRRSANSPGPSTTPTRCLTSATTTTARSRARPGIRLTGLEVAGGALTGQVVRRDRSDRFPPARPRPRRRVQPALEPGPRRGPPFRQRRRHPRRGRHRGARSAGRETGTQAEILRRTSHPSAPSNPRAPQHAATLTSRTARLDLEGALTETGGSGPVADAVGLGAFRRGRVEGAYTVRPRPAEPGPRARAPNAARRRRRRRSGALGVLRVRRRAPRPVARRRAVERGGHGRAPPRVRAARTDRN